MTQAWATSRWDRPCSYLSRRISRIFLTRSLRVGIASPSVQKAKDPAVRLPMSAHDPGNWVIQFGRKRSTSAEISDPLRPKQVIHFRRNRRSTSSEIRTYRGIVQDLRRPAVHREGAGHCRPLPESTRPQPLSCHSTKSLRFKPSSERSRSCRWTWVGPNARRTTTSAMAR